MLLRTLTSSGVGTDIAAAAVAASGHEMVERVELALLTAEVEARGAPISEPCAVGADVAVEIVATGGLFLRRKGPGMCLRLHLLRVRTVHRRGRSLPG